MACPLLAVATFPTLLRDKEQPALTLGADAALTAALEALPEQLEQALHLHDDLVPPNKSRKTRDSHSLSVQRLIHTQ